MLPDTEYKQAANNAEHHIQLTIDSINIAADTADVTGSVCRVFRLQSPAWHNVNLASKLY